MTRAYLVLLLAGCPKNATTPLLTEGDTDTDADGDTDSDTDADSDTDTDSDGDSDSDGDTDDTDVPVDVCAQPSCEVGTGRDAFYALNAGGAIQLVHGPQGGWHVDMAVRTYATGVVVRLRPQVTVVSGSVALAGSDPVSDTSNHALQANGQCAGDAWQLQAVFDDDPVVLDDICALEGVELELRMAFEELNGTVGECSQRGFAVLDPLDVTLCATP